MKQRLNIEEIVILIRRLTRYGNFAVAGSVVSKNVLFILLRDNRGNHLLYIYKAVRENIM